MAKIDLIFNDEFNDYETSVKVCELNDVEGNSRNCISIEVFLKDTNEELVDVVFDKSTAIKFAKTLRTEINKIKEDVNNG